MQNNTNNVGTYDIDVGNMEPGVYTIAPKQSVVSKIKRENLRLGRSLFISRVINISLLVVLIAVAIYTRTKFINMSKTFAELSERCAAISEHYNEALSANRYISERIEEVENSLRYYTVQASIIEEVVEPEVIVETIEQTTYSFPSEYSDIPLEDHLKEFIYTSAVEANISPEIMFAMAWKESTFRPDVKSGTNDHGLFQINEINFKTLADVFDYEYTDFCDAIYDPYVNTKCSIYLIKNIISNYNNSNWHHVLMQYNMGPTRAANKFAEGIYSSAYSRAIVEYAEENFNLQSIELK